MGNCPRFNKEFKEAIVKKPWDVGSIALKLTQMELLERLVARVPSQSSERN